MNGSARYGALTLTTALLAGCATTPGAGSSAPSAAVDPLEPMNRAVYNFNDAADRVVIKPLATVYTEVVPEPARDCVSNVFANLGEVWNGVNSLLQGKGADTLATWTRFAVNSTFGFAGCIDIASHMQGLERRPEDFGQTLGVWGFSSGPYLVLPFFGSSSIRDGIGLAADMTVGSPTNYVEEVRTRNSAQGLRLVSTRANLLQASRTLEGAALDPYVFVRDAYLQRRQNLIYDGEPPESAPPAYDDFDDAPPSAPAKKTP